MEEYANKFLELLRFVRYIRDEKVKVQHFLSGLPQSYKDRIEFYEPRTIEEAIGRLSIAMSKAKVNLITIRHGRTRRIRSLIKERRGEILLVLVINKGSHHRV